MQNRFQTRSGYARVVLACCIGTAITNGSQAQQRVEQQQSSTVVVSTGEVALDVVVRDKRGRLTKDLSPSDFEVYEDGVKQEINSFRFVSSTNPQTDITSDNRQDQGNGQNVRPNPANLPARLRNGTDNPEVPGVTAMALVFDRLTPDARARATQAALSYVQETGNKDELFGVFLTDLSLVVLQPFTEDHQLVKSAIEKAGVHSPSLYISNNEETRRQRDQATLALLKKQTGGSGGAGQPVAATPTMLEWLEEMERNEQGNATTRGLLFVASALRALPGRKAVIFFSEGMILPPAVMETFRAIIDTANRSNVSFYAVDAAGLRAESKSAETIKEMKSRSDYRMAQLGSSEEPQGPMMKGLERNEDLLRLNPDSGLGQLADETGGFLITDSNDLKARLRKVDEDLHSYYVLNYRSNNQNYDGHFRNIEVKLKRLGLEVQSRKGYFGIKGTFASPVLSYEAPALAALENSPKADAFPFYARGFSFPERERIGLAPIIADLPLAAFSFGLDQEKKIYSTDFSVVALLKDQTGQVVRKLSRHYRLSGPLDKLEYEKSGRILFYREADLAAGRYTLETIAYDTPTGRASVRTGNIEVVATEGDQLRLSDIVILKRAEPTPAVDEKQSNPFRVGNVLVIPSLGEPIRRTLKEAPFFFAIYTPPGTIAGPKLTIQLRQREQTLAQMPGDLPKPDAAGRIQYLAGLPLEKLPAGSYELRITVGDGTTTVTRSAYFTIAD
jgi:VWFA-related protein